MRSSEKLQLCHARSLHLMVLLFSPLSVFFGLLRVRCGSIIQRVRDISDLSVFTAIVERTLWRASRTVHLSCFYWARRTRAFMWQPRVVFCALLSRDEAESFPKNYTNVWRRSVWGHTMLQDLFVQFRDPSKHCVVPVLRLLFRWLRWPQSSFCSWSFMSIHLLRLDHCISCKNVCKT